MVLVAVGEEYAGDLLLTLQEIGDVRQDQVDAGHVLLRKHEPRVDDDELLLPFERPHVDADLAEAAEREIAQTLGLYSRRSCSDSGFGAATGTGGGGGTRTWSR